MARGPVTLEDRKRIELIGFRIKQLRDPVSVDASGAIRPPRVRLKRAAEKLVYEDVEWLLTRIERNWD